MWKRRSKKKRRRRKRRRQEWVLVAREREVNRNLQL